MQIAQHKRKENIVEYLIYMFQIEDVIRSCNLDIKEIEQKIIHPTGFEAIVLVEMSEWYEDLISQMKENGVEAVGHIAMLTDLIDELTDLHLILINEVQDKKYVNLFNIALPAINDIKSKSDKLDISEVECCLNGLYGLLLLRLKKAHITDATQDAMKTIAKLMAYLAKMYNDKNSGALELQNTLKN